MIQNTHQVPSLAKIICRRLRLVSATEDARIEQLAQRMGPARNDNGAELFDFVVAVDSHVLNRHLAPRCCAFPLIDAILFHICFFESDFAILLILVDCLSHLVDCGYYFCVACHRIVLVGLLFCFKPSPSGCKYIGTDARLSKHEFLR
jgi:hypothetical protein